MKERERFWEAGKQYLLKKDNLLICVLTGILLLVIAWPITNQPKEEGRMEQKNEQASGVGQEQGSREESWQETASRSLERRLEEMLEQMEGVGEVQVMVTLAVSAEKVVEKDSPMVRNSVQEEDSSGGRRNLQEVDADEQTVYNRTQSGEETPYVVKEMSPLVEGVSVVAKGGGNPLVQKNITEVIQALFGIEVHKIKVVKMKS